MIKVQVTGSRCLGKRHGALGGLRPGEKTTQAWGKGGFCLEKRECKSGVWLAVRGGKIPCLEEVSILPAGFV